tara:strand:- start:250 stop:369 length:120 start_codon:yes stop_codon:yes gene_type:complete
MKKSVNPKNKNIGMLRAINNSMEKGGVGNAIDKFGRCIS